MPIKVRVNELMTARFGPDPRKWPSATSLGRIMDVDRRTVQAWINGEVQGADFDVLEAWCKVLDVQPGDILVREP